MSTISRGRGRGQARGHGRRLGRSARKAPTGMNVILSDYNQIIMLYSGGTASYYSRNPSMYQFIKLLNNINVNASIETNLGLFLKCC